MLSLWKVMIRDWPRLLPLSDGLHLSSHFFLSLSHIIIWCNLLRVLVQRRNKFLLPQSGHALNLQAFLWLLCSGAFRDVGVLDTNTPHQFPHHSSRERIQKKYPGIIDWWRRFLWGFARAQCSASSKKHKGFWNESVASLWVTDDFGGSSWFPHLVRCSGRFTWSDFAFFSHSSGSK